MSRPGLTARFWYTVSIPRALASRGSFASYAQGAILLCIVGQELHDHQSPGLPEQEKR